MAGGEIVFESVTNTTATKNLKEFTTKLQELKRLFRRQHERPFCSAHSTILKAFSDHLRPL
jgi:hypothetical protein